MRMYWVEKLGWLLGNKPVTTVNNDEEHFSEDREYTETEALDLIKDELGIRPLYFLTMPEGMNYDALYIDEDAQWAKMFYLYESKVLTVLMDKSNKDMSFGVVYDGEDLGNINVQLKNVDVTIHKIQRDERHIAYSAEMEYGSAFYYVSADMDEEEFLSLIKNVEFW